MNRFWSLLFLSVPLLAGGGLVLVATGVWGLETTGLPAAISESGRSIDWLFRLVHGLCAFVLLVTGGGIGWAVWRYAGGADAARRATYVTSNTVLELTWVAIPTAILLALGFYQYDVWADTRISQPTMVSAGETVPVPPLVLVKARQYGWEFHYAGPDQKIETSDDFYFENLLVVPAGRDVVLQLESRDVIHSFCVPELRLKQDVVPGMSQLVWFRVEQPVDRLEVLCTELCGEGHYRMRAVMRVVSEAEFGTWLADHPLKLSPSALLR